MIRSIALTALATLATGCIVVPYPVYTDRPAPAPAEGAPSGTPNGAGTSDPAATLGDAPTSADLEGGDYGQRFARFAFTVEGSLEVEDEVDDASLFGLGFYVIPETSPVGIYLNTRFTASADGDPDLTDAFDYNAFGHPVVDEDLEAFVVNIGAVAPVNAWLNGFVGLGFAATAIESELRDPSGILGDDGQYFQRRDEDEELNVNVGALLTFDPLAVSAQWDSALEVFTFGLGFAF